MNNIIEYMRNDIVLSLLASSVPAYLIGAVSFARMINYIVTRKSEIEAFSEPVPHSDETFESDLVSATLVTKRLGQKYGCITSLLDMIKVALPTLVIKILLPDHPYFLLTAFSGIAGHNYPVYYGFIGGRGESPLLGALAVINWFGILIVNAAAIIAGFITGSVLVIRWGGYFFMIFWYWYFFNDAWYVAFMAASNVLFYLAMRKDLIRFHELRKKKGIRFTEEDVSEFILMGKGLGRTLDNYSLYSLLRKTMGKKKEDQKQDS